MDKGDNYNCTYRVEMSVSAKEGAPTVFGGE